ncbi:hypothetical protein [Dietzia alimentaria]|nr:hypothetical protein [Dietzia alimentaria]
MGSLDDLMPALLGMLPILTKADGLVGNLFGSISGSLVGNAEDVA